MPIASNDGQTAWNAQLQSLEAVVGGFGWLRARERMNSQCDAAFRINVEGCDIYSYIGATRLCTREMVNQKIEKTLHRVHGPLLMSLNRTESEI